MRSLKHAIPDKGGGIQLTGLKEAPMSSIDSYVVRDLESKERWNKSCHSKRLL